MWLTPPRLEQPDHVLCPWGKVRLALELVGLLFPVAEDSREHCMQAMPPAGSRTRNARSWLIADFCWEALLMGAFVVRSCGISGCDEAVTVSVW